MIYLFLNKTLCVCIGSTNFVQKILLALSTEIVLSKDNNQRTLFTTFIFICIVVHRLIPKQTPLFLTQLLTIFYQLNFVNLCASFHSLLHSLRFFSACYYGFLDNYAVLYNNIYSKKKQEYLVMSFHEIDGLIYKCFLT